MAKNDNLTDFLTDVADAIREKKGTTEKINPQEFSNEIKGIKTSSSMWTGHVDVEGLKAIGWDDEDIAYFQEHGVNWMEEDDELYKVSDDNKALYGVLTADNIQTYKDRIVYLPKIDFSGVTSMNNMFEGCRAMVAIPMIDTSNVISMTSIFRNCYSLVTIPPLNTSKVVNMSMMFMGCLTLETIPPLNTSTATTPQMFYNTYCILYIPALDLNKGNHSSMFVNNYRLERVKLKNLNKSLSLQAILLSKESLLYIIENEIATSAITITLHSYAYQRLAEDTDIVEALNNHPLVSLASA